MAVDRFLAQRPGLAWGEGSLRLAEFVRGQQGHLQQVLARLDRAGVEDVHQGRVAARRLRSVLKTFAPMFDERWARLYRLDLRSFAQALGAVRESDVRAQLLDETLGLDGPLTATETKRVAAVLRGAQEQAREQFAKRARGSSWSALTRALLARSEQPPRILRTDVSMAEVVRSVDGAWRKARCRLREHPADAHELHELRLALKHCRYALEVVADVKPGEAERLLRRLRRAQDAIGSHRDTVAADGWFRKRVDALRPTTFARIELLLVRRESRQRRAAARAANRILPAYEAWREAVRPLRKAARRGRASP